MISLYSLKKYCLENVVIITRIIRFIILGIIFKKKMTQCYQHTKDVNFFID